MALYTSVFSRYYMRAMGVKIAGETTTPAFTSADCVGKWEEELDVVNVTKKCRGVVVKQKPRGAGTGTVTFTGHIPYGIYAKIHDMVREDLKTDVQGYGNANYHKEFAITADIFDEDNVEMLVCYPRCIINTAPTCTIENGAEEVAEVEMEIALMPDSYGYCKYEIMADSLPSGTTSTNWMQSWTESMVRDTATLATLTIGSLTLNPTFSASTTTYTASTSNASDTITATAADSSATVVINNGSTTVTSGSAATWESGTNTVTVTVTKGSLTKTYTVTVTKS